MVATAMPLLQCPQFNKHSDTTNLEKMVPKGIRVPCLYQSQNREGQQNGQNTTLVISIRMNLPHQSHLITLYLKIASPYLARISLKPELILARCRRLHSILRPIQSKVTQPSTIETRLSIVSVVKFRMGKWLHVIMTSVRWNGFITTVLALLSRPRANGSAQIVHAR